MNALENIYTVQKELYIDTTYLRKSINWHIWKNHSFLLLQIIGSNKQDEYLREYKKCIKFIRKNMFKVLIESDVSLKEKLKIFICGCGPVIYTKKVIDRHKIQFEKDLMG